MIKPIDDNTRAQVRADWRQGMRQQDIAKQLGIAQGSVSKIVTGIPKRQKPLLVRTCVDCGVPLKHKTRCPACNQKWREQYNQDYYLRLKQRNQEQAILNNEDALDQMQEHTPEMRELYRIYRHEGKTPEQALREVLQWGAEVAQALEAIGIPDEGD